MIGRRAQQVTALSDVVRQRLEVLLAEVPPRRSAGVGPTVEEAAARSIEDVVPDAGSPAVPVAWERGVAFTRRHMTAVLVVVLVGCLWTGFSLFSARSTPVAVALSSATSQVPATQPTTQTSSVTPAGSPSPAATLVVHVLGAVKQPGIVRLPQGSRVFEAIDAAGGLTLRAAPGDLNLAAPVPDGAQIFVGTKASPGGQLRDAGGSGPGQAGSGTIDLNQATLAQLDTLPGVGPVTAQKIIEWRTAHGRFTKVQELQEVDGIGPKSYAQIAPHVRV